MERNVRMIHVSFEFKFSPILSYLLMLFILFKLYFAPKYPICELEFSIDVLSPIKISSSKKFLILHLTLFRYRAVGYKNHSPIKTDWTGIGNIHCNVLSNPCPKPLVPEPTHRQALPRTSPVKFKTQFSYNIILSSSGPGPVKVGPGQSYCQALVPNP